MCADASVLLKKARAIQRQRTQAADLATAHCSQPCTAGAILARVEGGVRSASVSILAGGRFSHVTSDDNSTNSWLRCLGGPYSA